MSPAPGGPTTDAPGGPVTTLRNGIGPTYRIQLTEDRGFAWTARLVPYLAHLGIHTVYLSPVA